MKPFDLQEYLENKEHKIATRDGRPVRIICTDSPIPDYPIVGFIGEELCIWTLYGHYFCNTLNSESDKDLFFVEDEYKLLPEWTLEAIRVAINNPNIPYESRKIYSEKVLPFVESLLSNSTDSKSENITKIDDELKLMIADIKNGDFVKDDFEFWYARLLECANKDEWENGHDVGFEEGKNTILKNIPEWKYNKNGAFGVGGSVQDLYLIRTSPGYYYLSSCVGPDTTYIELEEIEKLLNRNK